MEIFKKYDEFPNFEISKYQNFYISKIKKF